MIKIHRGSEPSELASIRNKELAEARTLFLSGALDSDSIGKGYQTVRSRLCEVQHFKCCYCERNNFEAAFNDVEHFRPTNRAFRGDRFSDHGYWWMAWTWKNLMFSCPNCNRSCKNDQFPLEPSSIPLVPEEKVPGKEIALLINPAAEDPIKHIQFKYCPAFSDNQWIPFPRNGSEKGLQTIKVLKLDRPGLLDLYDRHVEDNIKPIISGLSTAIDSRDVAKIDEIWNDQALVWLNPRFPFTGLSRDSLDQLTTLAIRRKWKLRLPRVR